MQRLSSLIAIIERSYVNVRGWWDYPFQTDRLCAAGTGQQGKGRCQTPRESAGTVQRGNQNLPRERSRLAGL
jgi:hypothetical protein